MKKLNLALSLAAGLFGGILSHYAWIAPVQAQTLTLAPKEIRAQSFALVDAKGVVQGVFSVDDAGYGQPSIKLKNGQGQEIWKAGGNGLQLVVASTNRK